MGDMFEELGIKVGNEEKAFNEARKIGEYYIPSYSEMYHLKDTNTYGDGEVFFGKPLLSEIDTRTFDYDGEEVTRHSVSLYLIDDDEEWFDMPINLKEDTDIQHNINTRSKLFPLIRGVAQCLFPEQVNLLPEDHELEECNLESIRKMVYDIPRIGLKVKTIDGGDIGVYNSFVLVSPDLEE